MTEHRVTAPTARAREAGAGVRWEMRWETSLAGDEHTALGVLLTDSYRPSEPLAPGRSWFGARPELRVVGHAHDGPVAHAAVVRRFLRAPERRTEVLVGDVGLVAVASRAQGGGVGSALMTTLADVLAGLGLPYGFLTCAPDVRPFYERNGWGALPDQDVHAVTVRHGLENRRHGMLLPVHAARTAWPTGPIHRDGQEI